MTKLTFFILLFFISFKSFANVWVLNDIEGAQGKGHVAIIIGNEDLGYYLATQAPESGTTAKEFWLGKKPESIYVLAQPSLPELIQRIHRLDTIQIYDQALEFETSTQTDFQLIEYIGHRMTQKKHYSVLFNNCGQFVQDVLDIADIDNNWSILPNNFFTALVKEYPDKEILDVAYDLQIVPHSYPSNPTRSEELWHDN